MRVSRYILGLLFLLLGFFAPTHAFSQCSAVSISGPETVKPGEPLRLEAKLNANQSSGKPVFKWTISVGTIVSEVDKSSIEVDTAGLGGQLINISVSVSGLQTACSVEASFNTTVKAQDFVCGLAFDQYGDIRFEDEKARLDNFAIQLTNLSTAQGYLIAYAGKRTYVNEAALRLKRARDYLVNFRGIDSAKVVTVDGGYRAEFSITLIVVPTGAEPPQANKTDLIPANELDFSKPRPKTRQRSRR